MKLSTTLLIILAPELALSWSPSSHQRSATFTRLQVSNANDSDKPSWQDIWSYDSAMSNAYSAAFIPAEWKKSNTNDPFTNLNQVAVESSDDTSWQDIWSYDNAMSNAYSAAFIPADWIKKLPCALGLADCDTPEKLKRPAPADGSGVEGVDVMQFLNIKRVGSLNKKE